MASPPTSVKQADLLANAKRVIIVDSEGNNTEDSTSLSSTIIDFAHHEIHEGNAFAMHLVEEDFDKASEIGILFTTPNTTKWLHVFILIDCGGASRFDVLESPTLDTGNYPTTFYTPINRNRNSDTISTISSVRASPVVNQASLKLKANSAPVSADGTTIHTEIIGTGKKGGAIGNRDSNEYILKANTTYYFRLNGLTGGSDNVAASLELNWYEHIGS